MAAEPTNHHNPTSSNGEKQKTFDQEIKELISSLTKRLSNIQRSQKPGSSSTLNQENEDDSGVSIITLTGNNIGATMRGDTAEKPGGPEGLALPEQEELCTYVNNNFQAINNSIMLDGSYESNDPGVHLDITDCSDRSVRSRREKKGKKNETGSSKSEQHHRAEHSA